MLIFPFSIEIIFLVQGIDEIIRQECLLAVSEQVKIKLVSRFSVCAKVTSKYMIKNRF